MPREERKLGVRVSNVGIVNEVCEVTDVGLVSDIRETIKDDCMRISWRRRASSTDDATCRIA